MKQLTQKPFYYLRHGQTDWNVAKRCIGQIDIPLNSTGISQAKEAVPRVQVLGVSAIFYSPLARARETALIVGQGSNLPLYQEGGLREVCLGIKEGMPEDDPSDDFVSAWLDGSEINGGEPFDHFCDRVVTAVNECLAHASPAPPLIVAHSGVFIALASVCGFESIEIEHCQSYRFQPSNGCWLISIVRE